MGKATELIQFQKFCFFEHPYSTYTIKIIPHQPPPQLPQPTPPTPGKMSRGMEDNLERMEDDQKRAMEDDPSTGRRNGGNVEEDPPKRVNLLTPPSRGADWSPTCRGVQGGHLPSSGKVTRQPVLTDRTSVKAKGETTPRAMVLSKRGQRYGDEEESKSFDNNVVTGITVNGIN